jgi:hypothetical protein
MAREVAFVMIHATVKLTHKLKSRLKMVEDKICILQPNGSCISDTNTTVMTE